MRTASYRPLAGREPRALTLNCFLGLRMSERLRSEFVDVFLGPTGLARFTIVACDDLVDL
ncbi:MAG: hypothetical protein M3P30_03255 [Chloroflexota bacterium]|nr:hypothetical protein [Chloroflexota bacterium]